MALVESHLEQIATSAKSLADLEFPAPKIFTNAILENHEITTLIRDTETHERALFSVDSSLTNKQNANGSRRTTLFGGEGTNRRKTMQALQQGPTSAVAKVLGNDMLRQIQQSSRSRGRRSVNVEVLLQGAERLCAVYSVAGAMDRIAALRNRYIYIAESVATYEAKVLAQQAKLSRINSGVDTEGTSEDEKVASVSETTQRIMTEEDMRAEENEIRELEAKKKSLEERVAGMEKDLGGLLR